jgi:hypothetical protein
VQPDPQKDENQPQDPREATTWATLPHFPDAVEEVRETCSQQPSPALASGRPPRFSCCYTAPSTNLGLLRPMAEKMAQCPLRGRVVVRFTVEEDGAIVDACLEHPRGWTNETANCALRKVLEHRFPAQDYDLCPVVKLVYPVVFEEPA